jgi:hypothetical protein
MAPVAPARDTAQHHARATAGEVPRTHMGGLNSREFLLTASWLRTPTTVSDPRSEPFDMTRLVAELDQTHIRSASKQARHQYPAYGGQGSGGRDHSQPRLFRPSSGFGRPPGSAGTDQTPVDGDLRCTRRSGGFHRRPLDDDTSGCVFPKCNEELSGQSGDHCLADATIHADPLVEPTAECRIRLMS